MAIPQRWSRNISKKKGKKQIDLGGMTPKPVVNDEPLEALKRRAEDLGLIVHARRGGRRKGGKK